MNETVQEYIARITGLVADRDTRTVMAETPGRLRALVTSATPEQLTWTSAPTRWTITQIVGHLADAEVVGAWRFRSVLAEDNVPIAAYDQNTWAAAFRYEEIPAAESLALFEVLRAGTLRVLRSVDPARLEHAGVHRERGRESITRIKEMYAGHDLNHLAQIERLLNDSRQAR
jgi:DinB superfamily